MGHFLFFSSPFFENATKSWDILSFVSSLVSVPNVETMKIPSIKQMS